jgi:NADH-quinone oxidoreductase subunit J
VTTNLDMLILVSMIILALWTVMARSLLRAAIALAFTSAAISILMFRLNSPLAAVFELSVCTGLVSVLFISTIGLTHPSVKEETFEHMIERMKKFKALPFIIAGIGIALSLITVKLSLQLPMPEVEHDARVVMWNQRPLDIVGQIIILLSGVFGVIILFKEHNKK